jgi:hypothetical protein
MRRFCDWCGKWDHSSVLVKDTVGFERKLKVCEKCRKVLCKGSFIEV